MNWYEWDALSPEKQIKALRADYRDEQADELKRCRESIEPIRNQKSLLKRCLFAEVNLLRVEEDLLREYEQHTAPERKFMSSLVTKYPETMVKTVKYIAEHTKRILFLKKKIETLRTLRVDIRSIFKKENGLLKKIEREIKCPTRKTAGQRYHNLVRRLLAKGIKIETDPELLKMGEYNALNFPPGYD